jgi:hypothetical protein
VRIRSSLADLLARGFLIEVAAAVALAWAAVGFVGSFGSTLVQWGDTPARSEYFFDGLWRFALFGHVLDVGPLLVSAVELVLVLASVLVLLRAVPRER